MSRAKSRNYRKKRLVRKVAASLEEYEGALCERCGGRRFTTNGSPLDVWEHPMTVCTECHWPCSHVALWNHAPVEDLVSPVGSELHPLKITWMSPPLTYSDDWSVNSSVDAWSYVPVKSPA
jgi:hypothetical protein